MLTTLFCYRSPLKLFQGLKMSLFWCSSGCWIKETPPQRWHTPSTSSTPPVFTSVHSDVFLFLRSWTVLLQSHLRSRARAPWVLSSVIAHGCPSFLSVPHVSPSASVFRVGGLRPRLQQQHYSHRSSAVQHGTGPVQPPSHGSSSLHLCRASYRWVLLLLHPRSSCLVDTPRTQVPFVGFLYQVTLQELCGSELRKEGSAPRTNMSPVPEFLCDRSSLAHSVLVHSASAGKKNCLQSICLSEGVYSLT